MSSISGTRLEVKLLPPEEDETQVSDKNTRPDQDTLNQDISLEESVIIVNEEVKEDYVENKIDNPISSKIVNIRGNFVKVNGLTRILDNKISDTFFISANYISIENSVVGPNADVFLTDDFNSYWMSYGHNLVRYTVTFYDGYSRMLEQKRVLPGWYAEPPIPPEVEGYTFKGWAPPPKNVNKNIDVYAIYNPIMHLVTFLDYKNNEVSKQKVAHGHSAIEPLPPYKPGHEFKGWDKDFSSVNSSLIIKPIFEIQTVSACFKDHRGFLIGGRCQDIILGQDAVPPTLPTLGNYIFLGWDKDYRNLQISTDFKPLYAPIEEAAHSVMFIIDVTSFTKEVLSCDSNKYSDCGAEPEINPHTILNKSKQAIKSLMDFYNSMGPINKFRILTFSDVYTSNINDVNEWMNIEVAKEALDKIQSSEADKSSFYDAIEEAKNVWKLDKLFPFDHKGPNLIYFISSQAPKQGEGLLDRDGVEDWRCFLTKNRIKAISLGVGFGKEDESYGNKTYEYLNEISYDGVNKLDTSSYVQPEINLVKETLIEIGKKEYNYFLSKAKKDNHTPYIPQSKVETNNKDTSGGCGCG